MSALSTMSVCYVRTRNSNRLQLRVNGRLVALGGSGRTRSASAEADATKIIAQAAAQRGLYILSIEMDYSSDHRHNVWTMRAVLGVGAAPVAAPVVKRSSTTADEAHADACAEAAAVSVSEMIDGYLTCALWASVPLSEDESADASLFNLGYDRANCCADTRADARAACEGFVEAHGDALRAACEDHPQYTPERAGHDLFLSRNGHGAGFFDHGEHPCWDVLQAAARGLGATEDVTENADGTCTVR
jgi:hypothetical protein